jgi:hypothetical protein
VVGEPRREEVPHRERLRVAVQEQERGAVAGADEVDHGACGLDGCLFEPLEHVAPRSARDAVDAEHFRSREQRVAVAAVAHTTVTGKGLRIGVARAEDTADHPSGRWKPSRQTPLSAALAVMPSPPP